MKKIIYFLAAVALLCGCTDDGTDSSTGNIYGVVTDKATAEPMRATGVELWKVIDYSWALLTKTVTYDDGHYEFNDLEAGEYRLTIVAEGYNKVSYDVVVEAGRTAKGDMQLEKVNTYMTVRTLEVTGIGGNFATLNGDYTFSNFNYPDEVGFVYATHAQPANGGTKITASTNNFSVKITNLAKATYYVQAYAKNSKGTEYGEERSFQITGQPSVTTLPATNVTTTTATLNGKIDFQGDPPYTERGFVYSNSFQNPSVEDDPSATTKRVVSGTSTDFSANISGLTTETTYYARAYVTNSTATVYGESVNFKPTAIVDYIILPSDGIMVQKNDISSGANWNAAKSLCEASRIGGYSDWRLPTKGELQTLYNQRNTIGGFSTSQSVSWYWSGTQYSTYSSYYAQDFYDGHVSYWSSSNTYRVRAVRSLP